MAIPYNTKSRVETRRKIALEGLKRNLLLDPDNWNETNKEIKLEITNTTISNLNKKGIV